jgi:glucosamine--fructose-6-phosphate aminotransferase (isomerizing)
MASTFLAELEESPAALHSLLSWCAGPGEPRLRAFAAGLSGVRRVIVVGMGTSSFALLTLRDGLAAAGVRLHAEEAGEWLHGGETPASGERLVLCSQSGESVELVRLAKRGLPAGTVVVTNRDDSTLGRAGALSLLLQAGDESAISTKTYANTLALGHLAGAAVAGDGAAWSKRLGGVADALAEGMADPAGRDAIAAAADHLAGCEALAVVGRGGAVPAVRQLALTLAEGAGLLAVPFVGGSFRHGPMEACGPRLGVVAFADRDSLGELVLGACADAARLGSPVAVLHSGAAVPKGCRHIPLPAGPDAADLSLRASVAQGRLVHELAARRGREAGVFHVNTKVTVIE